MKLLIITQKVDRTDPILGFFHKWIEEFALHCDQVTVIGQQTGSYDLPSNVKVISLEKERGRSNVSQVLRFWKLIWQHSKDYDRVLVHMTPIWILIGAPLWLIMRKPMYLWYEIKRGSWKLSMALLFVKKVFAASKHGLPKVAKKQVTVGHGIDIDTFRPVFDRREAGHLVTAGRVTRIKHYDQLLRLVANLPGTHLTIAGGTITEADKEVEKDLLSLMHSLGIADRISMGWVAPEEMPSLMQRADVFLHASQGGLDKVILQAMASACPTVSTSIAAQEELPPECRATADTLLEQTQKLLSLSLEQKQVLGDHLRSHTERDHSLSRCIERQVTQMQ
ncbi:hypothetical protein CL635_01715 [bacterium]|nr:hypothetical protein [bacterium]|tara:strand:+ start:31972 stop:32979 length:1008 start_codon:yes stop_codon:yes gene_type:complete